MEQGNITDWIIRWSVRLYSVVYAFQSERLRATDVNVEAVSVCACVRVLVLRIEEDIESNAHCQI